MKINRYKLKVSLILISSMTFLPLAFTNCSNLAQPFQVMDSLIPGDAPTPIDHPVTEKAQVST